MAAHHVTMHHPVLGVEREMPERAVRHWQRSGWKVGELPAVKPKAAKPKAEPAPMPEGEHDKEGEA